MAFPTAFKINGPQSSTAPRIIFTTKLDGILLRFRLAWNLRFEYWEMSISSTEGEDILVGCKVVADWDMFSPFSDIRLPPGQLVCRDGENIGVNPGRNDFRDRHFLMYIEKSDPEPTGVETLPFDSDFPPA